MKPENTGQKQGGRFKAGESGNPSGKPKGARNKTTLAMQELLEGEAEHITRKAIELAKAGDMAAIRLVLERLLPARKDNPVCIDLPPIKTAADASASMAMILHAVSAGEITPSEGKEIAGLCEIYRRLVETEELEKRILRLEESNGKSA